jgi:hypothetical protein
LNDYRRPDLLEMGWSAKVGSCVPETFSGFGNGGDLLAGLSAAFHKYGDVDVGRSGGVPRSAPYRPLKGYPTGIYFMVGQRMERGRDCVERNRSERAKVASVAEWKPPREPGV